MIIDQLSSVIEQNKNIHRGFLRNLLKERLQQIALNFIYNSRFASLIFKGGSCLRVCFDLPRLSEDLDFDYDTEFSPPDFFREITGYIRRDQNFPQVEAKIYPRRLYLKFPVLRQLKIAAAAESDKLYLKIELTKAKKCPFHTEQQPFLDQGFSMMIRRYSLPDLMAGKMAAVLDRSWFRGKKNEITIKGRDYFDLYWYLQKQITPNYRCLDREHIWSQIAARAAAVKPKDLESDLINLIRDQQFVKNFCQNFNRLIQAELARY